MPDLALDLRYLKCALVVAEQGSFRRAAEVLSLSQSTVSRRIILLEHRLGVPLFQRSRAGTRLTHAGERFIREAAAGAELLIRAANDLTSSRRGFVGELRIGLMFSLSRGFLADLLFDFRNQTPNVEVRLEEASSQSNVAGVLHGRLDAAFISGSPQLTGCNVRRLWDERVLVAIPEQHPLAKRPNVSWDEVRGETFLVSAEGPGPEIEDYLVRKLATVESRPTIIVQKIGRENLLNMVAKGFGLTLTTDATSGTGYVGVRFIPIGSDAERIPSSVVWAINNRNPALKKLLMMCGALKTS